jgi:osmotically-inducible protein OsmY
MRGDEMLNKFLKYSFILLVLAMLVAFVISELTPKTSKVRAAVIAGLAFADCMSKYAPQYFYFSESEVAKSVAENCAYAAANWHSACISAGGSLGDCYQGPREIANTLEKLEAASGKPTATTASTPTASYVRPQPQPTDAPNPQLDAGLANSISEAILSATPTAKINVAVENGHVTLTGTVDTTADREAAARIAELRPSVRVITNSLVVQAAAQPPSDMPVTVDSGHESTVDRSDVKTSKELNAAGLRLLSARQSDFSEAKRTFEKAVQLDSSNIEALNNLGYVYSRIGDYRSAEATLLKVLAVAPTRRAAHGNLGYVEAKLGKTQEAVKHYCQYMQQFDSLERGKSALVRANAADPDPNVQAAIEATVANCTR